MGCLPNVISWPAGELGGAEWPDFGNGRGAMPSQYHPVEVRVIHRNALREPACPAAGTVVVG
jgi:hypothetical protein